MLTKIASAILSTFLAARAAAPATAHEEGRLVLTRAAVAPGDTLEIQGLEFAPGEYRLRLRGAFTTFDLPAVTASSQGTFRLAWVVPVESQPGAYRLVAVAPDGDRAATTDVTITETRADPAGGTAHATHAAQREPRSEAMPLERTRKPAEWAVIVLVIAVSLGGGVLLLRRG